MYKEETILATTNLTDFISKNIDDVIENSKIITVHMYDRIKRKICTVVQEYKDTISTNADTICEEINEIENPTIHDMLDNLYEEKIEEVNNNFYEKIMNIIEKTKGSTDTKYTKTINNISNEVKNNIFPKYTFIIKNSKELGTKKDETKTIAKKLMNDMLLINEYTTRIGYIIDDTENIYLGLNTSNINTENEIDKLQNKRKLCELRIIETMEKVITYKSMLMKTEKCMFELMNEIDNLHNLTYICESFISITFIMAMDRLCNKIFNRAYEILRAYRPMTY
ncbi:hypothetical protein BDAP_002876 [Binucleata daphniae]